MYRIFLLFFAVTFLFSHSHAQSSLEEKFSQVNITFSKTMSDDIYNVDCYTIFDSKGQTYEVFKVAANANKTIAYLLCQKLQKDSEYIVKISNMTDESGLSIELNTTTIKIHTKK